MLIVVEPYFKSLETGRRMALLGKDLGLPNVLGRQQDTGRARRRSRTRICREHEIAIAEFIPFDEGFPAAERAGQAPFDFVPNTPAVAAIAQIATELADDRQA